MKVEIFSDVVCPWCYLGHTRFAKAAEAFRAKGGTIEVTMRPFQLFPDTPAEPEPVLTMLERKFGDNAGPMAARVIGLAAEEGLELRYDRALSVNTLRAHRLVEVAVDQGLGTEMAERLFRAHFTDGLDVSDPEVLAGLAAEVGVRDTGEGAERVGEQLARARALGITGVPLFLFEEQFAVSGAQPVETFEAAIDEVAERTGRRPVTPLAAPGDGTCAV